MKIWKISLHARVLFLFSFHSNLFHRLPSFTAERLSPLLRCTSKLFSVIDISACFGSMFCFALFHFKLTNADFLIPHRVSITRSSYKHAWIICLFLFNLNVYLKIIFLFKTESLSTIIQKDTSSIDPGAHLIFFIQKIYLNYPKDL